MQVAEAGAEVTQGDNTSRQCLVVVLSNTVSVCPARYLPVHLPSFHWSVAFGYLSNSLLCCLQPLHRAGASRVVVVEAVAHVVVEEEAAQIPKGL